MLDAECRSSGSAVARVRVRMNSAELLRRNMFRYDESCKPENAVAETLQAHT